MQSHIDRGCTECVESLEFWRRVADFLAREPQFEPPAHLLRQVEQAYTGHKPWRWLRATARWAEQLFDSLQQPSLAFVRGLAQSDRHVVHEAAPFVIDLRLKTGTAPDSLSVIGQVLNKEKPDHGTTDVDVILLSGEDLVAKAEVTDNGEFELECEPHSDLSLFISIRGEQAIGIRLDN